MSFIWIFFLFLIQNTLDTVFACPLPPLLLIGVIFYALTEGPFFGFVIGCAAGFFLDLFGIGRIGTEMVIFGTLGALSGLAAAKIFRESLLTQILLPTLSHFIATFCNLLIFKMMLHEEWALFDLFKEALLNPQLLLTAALSPFIFRFLKRVSFIHAHQRSTSWGTG